MFPKAHTHCSANSSSLELNNRISRGTALQFTTSCVCSDVPEQIFVRTQAASNFKNEISNEKKGKINRKRIFEILKKNKNLKFRVSVVRQKSNKNWDQTHFC